MDAKQPDEFRVQYEKSHNEAQMSISVGGTLFESTIAPVLHLGDPYADFWMSYLAGSQISFPRADRELRIADLFCGPGGFSQGFATGARALGYNVRHQLLVDVDKGALDVAAFNHKPRLALNMSTLDLVDFKYRTADELVEFAHTQLLTEQAKAVAGEVDVLIAGPPCQGHSTANKNRKNFDQRNLLYLTVPALAIAWNVPTVVIENVPAVRASQQGVVQTTYRLLKHYGYSVCEGVLNAADIGWPQSRRRYFLIATKDRCLAPDVKSYINPIGRRSALPLSAAIGDLLDSAGLDFMTEEPMLSADNRRRIEILHNSESHDLPQEHRNAKAQVDGTTYQSVYGKMYWDRPAQTLTTGFMTPGRGRYVHPLRKRTLLPREAARLQGFPDQYRFDAFGEIPLRTSLARWIGDAVPTPLGFAAALIALAGGRSGAGP